MPIQGFHVSNARRSPSSDSDDSWAERHRIDSEDDPRRHAQTDAPSPIDPSQGGRTAWYAWFAMRNLGSGRGSGPRSRGVSVDPDSNLRPSMIQRQQGFRIGDFGLTSIGISHPRDDISDLWDTVSDTMQPEYEVPDARTPISDTMQRNHLAQESEPPSVGSRSPNRSPRVRDTRDRDTNLRPSEYPIDGVWLRGSPPSPISQQPVPATVVFVEVESGVAPISGCANGGCHIM